MAAVLGGGSITSTDTPVAVPVGSAGQIGIQISGTYSGTLKFQASCNGVDYQDVAVTPIGATQTPVTSTTSTGIWTFTTGSFPFFRVNPDSFASGTAVVSLSFSQSAASNDLTSGGGGGGVSSIASSDSTLTITNVAGNVDAVLNLAAANNWTAAQTTTITDAGTNTAPTALTLDHESSGTPTTAFGVAMVFKGKSSTTAAQDMGAIRAVWTTATHASRATALEFRTLTAAGSLTTGMTLDGVGKLAVGGTHAATATLDVRSASDVTAAILRGASAQTAAIVSIQVFSSSPILRVWDAAGNAVGITINAVGDQGGLSVTGVAAGLSRAVATFTGVTGHTGAILAAAAAAGPILRVFDSPAGAQAVVINAQATTQGALVVNGTGVYAANMAEFTANSKTTEIDELARIGVQIASTALVTIAAGTAAAGTAPLKLTSGTNLTAPEAGAIEYDGTLLTCTNGTSTRFNVVLTLAPLTAYAAGTAYSLTNSAAALDFGTTDPAITINKAGTYLIRWRVNLQFNGATFAANRTVTLKLRRTNNTAADLTGGTTAFGTGVVTTVSGSCPMPSGMPEVVYTTANTDDAITIFGSVDTVPTAGSLDATEAMIEAVRLY